MAFNLKEVQFVKYKGKTFPLNEVLDLLNIPKTSKVEIVGPYAIVS